ncbi:MAG TPA: hypothetical protein VKE73_07765, partial [Myxococcota bacterium]|nr:hypothetical protein [Myxococcota bacterium]
GPARGCRIFWHETRERDPDTQGHRVEAPPEWNRTTAQESSPRNAPAAPPTNRPGHEPRQRRPEGVDLPEMDLSETPPVDFERAIHTIHGADANLIERIRVTEYFEGKRVGEREVLVFKLQDHPRASYCYAWEMDGDLTTVLGIGSVKNALDAVRASILASR